MKYHDIISEVTHTYYVDTTTSGGEYSYTCGPTSTYTSVSLLEIQNTFIFAIFMCCISLKSQRFLMDHINMFDVGLDLGDASTPSNTQSKDAEG